MFTGSRRVLGSVLSRAVNALGRRNLSHVAIHVYCESLSVFGSVGGWKTLRLELRNCYAITIFTGGFCLEDGGVLRNMQLRRVSD